MSRFTNPTQTVFPVQGFPYTAPGPLNPMYPAGGMSAPGTASGQIAPGPVGGGVPQTPNAVQTPDTSYWSAQTSLQFIPYNVNLLPPGVGSPAPQPDVFIVWKSPIFDLRPNLVAAPQQATGQPLARGSAAEVAVKIAYNVAGLPLTPIRVYNVYAVEVGDPFSPANVTPVVGLEPVSSLMASDTSADATRTYNAVFTPPPGIRFWQVCIVICQVTAGATVGPVTLWASAY